MKAKKVNENLGDILKGKTEDEIINSLNSTPIETPEEYYKIRQQIKDSGADVKIPFEMWPLIIKIWNIFKKAKAPIRNIAPYPYVSIEGNLDDDHQFWIEEDEIDGELMFKMYPFIKLKKLKDLRLGNNYMLSTYEDFERLFKELNKYFK